jgi:hypothetical protein
VVVGDQIWVDVNLLSTNGGNVVYGVDVSLTFDKAKLEIDHVERGTGNNNDLTDGCVAGNSDVPIVLAPVTSATAASCSFNNSSVVGNANSSGLLQFGVVPFDWHEADNSGYEPTPIPADGTARNIAKVVFNVVGTGSSTIAMQAVDNNGNTCSSGVDCGTKDTNVASASSGGDVDDVLASVGSPITVNASTSGGCSALALTADWNDDQNVAGYEYSVVTNPTLYNCGLSSSCPTGFEVFDLNDDGNVAGYEYGFITNPEVYNCGL